MVKRKANTNRKTNHKKIKAKKAIRVKPKSSKKLQTTSLRKIRKLKNKAPVKRIKPGVVNKDYHPLLTFFVIALLLAIVSHQIGKIDNSLNDKQIVAELLRAENTGLALEYCRNMEYKNYECFDMYINAMNSYSMNYDIYICGEINVGKLPWWSTQEELQEALIKFREVKKKCLKR